MKLSYRATDSNGTVVYSDITPSLEHLAKQIDKESQIIEHSNAKYRCGRISNFDLTISAITQDKDALKSSRSFLTHLTVLLNSQTYILTAISTAEETLKSKNKRLIHNLVSINAHMMQELYLIIPQAALSGRVREYIPKLEAEIQAKPKKVAATLLSLAKHNAAMKNEFAVFQKLDSLERLENKKLHPVHKVIMNVAYLFFSSFTDKSVRLVIEETKEKALLDYESTYVALYHMFENATKYIANNSELAIRVEKIEEFTTINFDMISSVIYENETLEILNEGVSGRNPKARGTAGSGIGLSLVQKVMSLHGGSMTLSIFPNTRHNLGGDEYQRNLFQLNFPDRYPGTI